MKFAEIIKKTQQYTAKQKALQEKFNYIVKNHEALGDGYHGFIRLKGGKRKVIDSQFGGATGHDIRLTYDVIALPSQGNNVAKASVWKTGSWGSNKDLHKSAAHGVILFHHSLLHSRIKIGGFTHDCAVLYKLE